MEESSLMMDPFLINRLQEFTNVLYRISPLKFIFSMTTVPFTLLGSSFVFLQCNDDTCESVPFLKLC